MINTMTPGAVGPKEQKNEAFERITQQYGKPEEKQREAVKKLGKDEFFKMMVNQMQHQDPMKPHDNEQMVAQLAQFSSLEQMANVNKNLEAMMANQASYAQLGAASLIGKFVTADASRISHLEGKMSDLKFELPKDAKKVRISVLNDHGESIREIEQGDTKKGDVKLDWDGKRSNGLPAPTGQYMISVLAEDDNGRNIAVQMTKTEAVNGVGFEGKETVLFTGDPKSPKKMFLKAVSRIIDPMQTGGVAPGANGMGAAMSENPFQAMLDAQGIKAPGTEDTDEGGGAPAGMMAAGGLPQGMSPEMMQQIQQQMQQSMQGQAPAQARQAMNNPYEFKIDEPRAVEGIKPGQTAKYKPIPIPGTSMGPKPPEAPKPSLLGKDANPAAELYRKGEIGATNDKQRAIDLREIPEADSSERKSIPSSQEGSVAGNLGE